MRAEHSAPPQASGPRWVASPIKQSQSALDPYVEAVRSHTLVILLVAGAVVAASLVWLAFRLSYRQGRLCERVRMTPDDLFVSRVLPSGHESRWRLQPFWTRVAIDRPVRHESQVRLVSKGGVLILGSFLSPKERGEFADALSAALAGLKRG